MTRILRQFDESQIRSQLGGLPHHHVILQTWMKVNDTSFPWLRFDIVQHTWSRSIAFAKTRTSDSLMLATLKSCRLILWWRNSINKNHEYQKYASCEDRTHDLQISTTYYETDALPTALTRHLCGLGVFFLSWLLIEPFLSKKNFKKIISNK